MTPRETPSGTEPKTAEVRKLPELMLRVLSAVVLAAIALGAVIASPWSFLGLVVVGGGLLTWEWGSLTRGNGFDGTALIGAVCVTAVAIFIALSRPELALLIFGATAVTIYFGGTSKPRATWRSQVSLMSPFRPRRWSGCAATRISDLPPCSSCWPSPGPRTRPPMWVAAC
ncbi:hypothetical protein AUC69_02450 [Methyloceanibacter superfactus]|uniref:Phosphatidate cytidylyltransferase n=1 Tax=Methyloceanibacter superfactus TaxID=1774969 RepID=A0A1E3VPZ2_9HYPH|nr:hypothetical protein [Methyloceanibacter superfactus]ODR95391.1 hypothetical protein AUC69_02450 [Methyloceanibacter superfactus]